MDDRCEGNEANAIRKRCILEARRRGEVIIACCHLNNPLTGGDSWDNSSAEVVRGIWKTEVPYRLSLRPGLTVLLHLPVN